MHVPSYLLLAQQTAQASQGNPLMGFAPFILIFAIFYFMMIRPQQRKDKERRKQIEELRAGTRVLFGGGILGTIIEAKQATFRVEIADRVQIEIARSAVNRVLKDGEIATLEEPR